MKLIPWMVVLSLGLVGCSGSKSAQNVSQETPQIELSDADEFIENPNEEPISESTPEETAAIEAPVAEEPIVADTEAVESAPMEEPVADNVTASSPDVTEEAPVAEAAAPVISNEAVGSEKTYTVQKNETLMLIAFKLYGDYEKWKELANYNRDTLKGNISLTAGMKLRYMAPAEEFVWNPEGLPYLIRTGDTLSGISGNVYGTQKKWKMIWDNNRPLIKDPNRIFAGFTIYYLENGREVASEL